MYSTLSIPPCLCLRTSNPFPITHITPSLCCVSREFVVCAPPRIEPAPTARARFELMLLAVHGDPKELNLHTDNRHTRTHTDTHRHTQTQTQTQTHTDRHRYTHTHRQNTDTHRQTHTVTGTNTAANAAVTQPPQTHDSTFGPSFLRMPLPSFPCHPSFVHLPKQKQKQRRAHQRSSSPKARETSCVGCGLYLNIWARALACDAEDREHLDGDVQGHHIIDREAVERIERL